MVGTTKVRWCPRCRTWGKAKRITVDPSLAYIEGAVPFEYVREDYRCHSCTREFSATRITSCEPGYVWSARNVLAKLHSIETASKARRAIPLSWEGHPELADFSAAIRPAPAANA